MNPQQPQTQFPGQRAGQPMGQPAAGQGPQIQMPAPQMTNPQMPGQQFPGQAPVQGQMPGQPMVPGQAILGQAISTQPTTKKDEPLATQTTLQISELRDGMVIMKDGSFRAVVVCKSINFDLMSEEEREGVEFSYQGFLNSLDFTIQILVRSQRVDIGPYIEQLAEIRRNNDNMLLGVLMDDYINFIDVLSQEANIMDKSFFVVIPYYASADAEKLVQETKNFFKSFGKNKAPEVTRIDRVTYDKAVSEINNRVDVVVSGLAQVGVRAVRLNTKELAEIYYNFNNPDTALREPLADFSQVATTYVRKGVNNG